MDNPSRVCACVGGKKSEIDLPFWGEEHLISPQVDQIDVLYPS